MRAMEKQVVDITLLDGETPESLIADLTGKFEIEMAMDPMQACPGGTSFQVMATSARGARQFTSWYANDGVPRPYLRGTAPVAKGQERV